MFRDNAPNSYSETGFLVERSEDGGVTFTTLTTLGQRNNVGNVRYFDTTIQAGISYSYRVAAVNSIEVGAVGLVEHGHRSHARRSGSPRQCGRVVHEEYPHQR